MRVLGGSQVAEQVASALGLQRDSEARPDEQYIVVLEGEDALVRYEAVTGAGTVPLALVAWGVPSAVLARLAPASPPIVVGCPDPWRLQAALDKGNNAEFVAHMERLARLETYLEGERDR